ncbi:MAG: hypothetical protein ACR2NP_14275 [Pirellulaceae bacterium]
MAARENQGYLIAVILLVLLSVILAIATFFGFSSMMEAAGQRDELQTSLDAERNASLAYQAQGDILKAYLGVEGKSIAEVSTSLDQLNRSGVQTVIDETSRITQDYDTDMAGYVNKPEGVDLNYRGLVQDVVAAMHTQHNNTAVLNENVTRAEQKMATEVARIQTELDERTTQYDEANRKWEEEVASHKTTRDELSSRLTDAEMKYKTVNQSMSTLQQDFNNAQVAHQNEVDAKNATIQRQKNDITQLTRTETDVADGMVVTVAPGLGMVTLNLGSDDNLRLKQTFSIYDTASSSFRAGEGKAKVEVTRILGPHLAQARITQQRLTDPILRNDFVVTSTWDPGYSVPVAIVGRIDLDDDGFSDLQRLISMVEQAGGTVVAYHDEEGNVTGQIDETTRYFVKGEDPLGKMSDGFDRLDRQREKYQTQVRSVRELMEEMGYPSEGKRIQRFDENLERGDLVPRQPTTIGEGSPFGDDN